jgi:L-ascorbate 6-phosphate lactonase
MVHSTWDDWLVGEIEGAAPDGMAVWYLGCNGFVVRTPETTIYLDPYFADGDPPELVRMIPVPMNPADASDCDAVLVSHEHIDHMHPPSYAGLLEAGATVHAPAASWEEPDYEGDLLATGDRRAVVAAGETVVLGDVTVHVRGSNDPDAIEPVSYVLEHESGTFFHAGDSRPAGAFEAVADEFDIEVGALALGSEGMIPDPGGGPAERTRWYMHENDAVEAAGQLEIDRLIPVHWDMWRGVGTDPKGLHEHAASFEYPRTIEPVTIGDRVDVGRPGIVQSAVQRS